MASAKVAISLRRSTVDHLDRLVEEGVYSSRSRAIQEAVDQRLARLSRDRLARECAKLDEDFESALAEEGMSSEVEEWPAY